MPPRPCRIDSSWCALAARGGGEAKAGFFLCFCNRVSSVFSRVSSVFSRVSGVFGDFCLSLWPY